jgi:pyocin large subunit-like protein
MNAPTGGPWAAPNWAASLRVGDVALKAVLLLLANYADENYSCYPSQQRIADETEQSERTVRRQVDLLTEAGLIRREARYNHKGKRTSDRYFLQLGATATKEDIAAAKARIEARKGSTSQPLPDSVTGSDSAPSTGHQVSDSGSDYRTPEAVTTGQNAGVLPDTSDRGIPKESPSNPQTSTTSAADASNEADATGSLPGLTVIEGEGKTAKRRTRLQADWRPTEQMLTWVREKHPKVDPNVEGPIFRDHHVAKGSTMADWFAAWRTWMANADKFAAQRRTGYGRAAGNNQHVDTTTDYTDLGF